MASLLPAPFGVFEVAARLSCLGFEPEQGLTPAAGCFPFRRLEPTVLDGQQPDIVRTVQHRVGISFPPIMCFGPSEALHEPFLTSSAPPRASVRASG